eukprot:13106458-Ditylum_brightwellii.AAC.1
MLLATELFKGHKFKSKEGHCYLGGYLRSTELTEGCVAEKVEDWVDAVNIFAEMMPLNPRLHLLVMPILCNLNEHTSSKQLRWRRGSLTR